MIGRLLALALAALLAACGGGGDEEEEHPPEYTQPPQCNKNPALCQ